MDKYSFIRKIASEAGVTQDVANKVVSALTRIIITEVRDNGENIALTGLGVFKQKLNNARIGRNPSNGEKVDIPANRTIAFKAQTTLKVLED